MRTARILPACLILVAAAGCWDDRPPPTVSPPPMAVADGVTLMPVTVAELEAAIAAHKGKVVFIECWFHGCGPCWKKFPKVVELSRAHAKDGLVVMSLDVSQDEWAEKDTVLAFLSEHRATFPNYIFRDDAKAAEDWRGSHHAFRTPSCVVFNRKGESVAVPDVPPEDMTTIPAFVKKLLDE